MTEEATSEAKETCRLIEREAQQKACLMRLARAVFTEEPVDIAEQAGRLQESGLDIELVGLIQVTLVESLESHQKRNWSPSVALKLLQAEALELYLQAERRRLQTRPDQKAAMEERLYEEREALVRGIVVLLSEGQDKLIKAHSELWELGKRKETRT